MRSAARFVKYAAYALAIYALLEYCEELNQCLANF
jgi:hypothetical protein